LNKVNKMPLPRPDLIFVAGPQAGERAVLMSDKAIVGRSPTADINITEEFVSRQHLEFTNSPDGWIVGTLSSSGMRINGRKFKPGKKVILATGDVVAIGLQTEILFVSPPDDPEAAIAQYRKAHGGKGPAGESDAPIELTLAPHEEQSSAASSGGGLQMPAGSPRNGESYDSERLAAASGEEPENNDRRSVLGLGGLKRKGISGQDSGLPGEGVSPADAEQARLRKRVKYAIIFGTYFMIMIVGFLVFKGFGPGGRWASHEPAILPTKEIKDCLEKPLNRAKDVAGTNAAQALNDALTLYENRNLRVGDLYRCVRQFKLYLAYEGQLYCDNPRDDEKYKTARTELMELVDKKYFVACDYEKQFCWRDAKAAFDDLLLVVPEHQQDDPVSEVLVTNLTAHLNYVSGKIKKK
jgi:hypothetical protein